MSAGSALEVVLLMPWPEKQSEGLKVKKRISNASERRRYANIVYFLDCQQDKRGNVCYAARFLKVQ